MAEPTKHQELLAIMAAIIYGSNQADRKATTDGAVDKAKEILDRAIAVGSK